MVRPAVINKGKRYPIGEAFLFRWALVCFYLIPGFILSSHAQEEGMADYLRNRRLPLFSILKTDSSKFNSRDLLNSRDLRSGKKVILFYFSSDCPFCSQETDSILAISKLYGDIQIVMASFEPLDRIKKYSEDHKLERFPNITVGRDTKYFFIPYYEATQVPFLVLYDTDGNLIKKVDGIIENEQLLGLLKVNDRKQH